MVFRRVFGGGLEFGPDNGRDKRHRVNLAVRVRHGDADGFAAIFKRANERNIGVRLKLDCAPRPKLQSLSASPPRKAATAARCDLTNKARHRMRHGGR